MKEIPDDLMEKKDFVKFMELIKAVAKRIDPEAYERRKNTPISDEEMSAYYEMYLEQFGTKNSK